MLQIIAYISLTPPVFLVQEYCFYISIVQGALTSLGIPIWWCDLKTTSEKASHCGKSWQKVSIWPVWNVTIRIHFWSQKPTLTESKVCHLANQSSRRLRWNSGSKDYKVLQSQTWNTQSHTIWRGIMPPIFASKHELLAFMDIQNPQFCREGLLLHVCPVTVVMHALCHNLIFSNRTKDFSKGRNERCMVGESSNIPRY